MKRHVFVLATPLLATTVILAGCQGAEETKSREAMSTMDVRQEAPMAEMAAGEPMSADAVAGPNVRVSAAPGVAFNYRYAFRVPDAKIAAVQEEHAAACETLGLSRCRITGMRYSLIDEDEVTASLAFKRAALEAGHVLLEPLAHAEIVVPEAVVGGVVGDLQSRRGTVRSIAPRGTSVVVTAEMPLSSTFDWVSRLRGITGGRGTAVVKADGYGVLPETEARVLLTPA